MSVVLITGCSSGFGLHAAVAFARAGDTVYASMRDTGKGAALRAAVPVGCDVRVVPLDVTVSTSHAPLIERIVRESGRLDVLVNNAGMIRPGAFEDLDESTFRGIMETNFFGPFALIRAVLPQMRRQHGGTIIMISSLSGIAGLPADVAYTASKFAVEGATEALRHEIDRWKIRVALVEAGLYATGIFAPSVEPRSTLPRSYPADSPYRALVEYKWRELQARLPQAMDPAKLGELLVDIARSDGGQLRWPADDVARRVLATMFAQDDGARDGFLRSVSGTDWWSAGDAPPGG